jgi:hypothetical protein
MVTKKLQDSIEDTMTTSETYTSQQNVHPTINKKKFFSRKQKTIIGILIAIIIFLGAFYYKAHYSKVSIEKRAQAETIRLVKEVRKIIILPETDIPAIFDIQDPVLLTNQQAFFAGSQKGDKLLVYPQLGKAIVYSPDRKMIVNVGPVTFDQTKPATDTGILKQGTTPAQQ